MPAAALRSLRTAVVLRLKAAVPAVAGRVYAPPLPVQRDSAGKVIPLPMPYLVVSADAEGYAGHYGHAGSESGATVKGFVSTKDASGDTALLELWEQTYAALQDVPLAVAGHQWIGGEIRLQTRYPDPDVDALQFAARYEALTANAP